MRETELQRRVLHAADILAAAPTFTGYVPAIGYSDREAFHGDLRAHAVATATAETMLRAVAACLTDQLPTSPDADAGPQP